MASLGQIVAQAGTWFSIIPRRSILGGTSVLYASVDCMGQAYINAFNGSAVPARAGVGPDPATGAVGGVPVRLVAFLANDPDATPSAGIPVESQSSVNLNTGQLICLNSSFSGSDLLAAEVVGDPDLSGFEPPFRAGLQ